MSTDDVNATDPQRRYLRILGVKDVPAALTKSEASRMIKEAKLQRQKQQRLRDRIIVAVLGLLAVLYAAKCLSDHFR